VVEGQLLAGRYRLLSLLGQGGAGDVWRAEDVELGRFVAVKMLRRREGDPVGAAARLRSEARAAAQLSHPNVISTYDVGTTADLVFLVMELVGGRDLAQLLRSEGLPAQELVADVAVQAARALDAAHAAGIVHRDVKPGNLLMAADGTLKITDFGIAEAAGMPNMRPNQAGGAVLFGTAAYVAPEQVRGEPATPASDRYSLGCVLYELLAGTPPFTAGTVDEVLRQHLYADPVPLRNVRPDVEPGLGEAVMRLLAKDPTARPATAAALLAALNGAALNGAAGPAPVPAEHTQLLPLPTEPPAEPTSYGVVPEEEGRRRFPLLPVLIALAAVALLGLMIFLYSGGSPEPSAEPASTPTSTVKPSAKPKTPTPSPTPTRSPSPTASKTANPVTDLRTLARLLRETRGRGMKVAHAAARDIDAAADAYAAGDIDTAAEKYRDARKRLAEARDDGRWQPTPQIADLLRKLDGVLRQEN